MPRRASIVIESASGDIAGEGLAGYQRIARRRAIFAPPLRRADRGRGCLGDIDVVAVAEIDLSARTVSGDVEVRAGTLRGLRASTTSGDLKIAGRFSSRWRVRGRDRQWRRPDRPGWRPDHRDDDRHRRPSLRRRGTHRGGRGHRSVVIGSRGPVMTFRSLSGDLRSPARRDRATKAWTAAADDDAETPAPMPIERRPPHV